jgi:lysophospholipase L1-like esterase
MRIAVLLLLTSCGGAGLDTAASTDASPTCDDPPPAPVDCGPPPGAPVLWLDGTDPLGSTVNKGSIGGTFSAAAGAEPLFRPACIGTVKRPCLRFDGVDDALTSSLPASSWTFLHSDAYTCSTLARFPAHSSEKTHVIVATAGTATSQRGFTFANDDAVSAEERLRVEQKNGGSTTNNRIVANSFFTPQLWNRLTVTSDPMLSADKIVGYLDGVARASSGAQTAVPSTLAPSNPLSIGAFGTLTAGFLDGDVVDVVCYDSVVDVAALDAWQACLASSEPYGPRPGVTLPASPVLCDPLDDPCVIGVMGDSLTSALTPASWVNGFMRTAYPRSHAFRNAAVGGTTIEIARVNQWQAVLQSAGLHVLMMLIGTNDIGLNNTPAVDILADIDEVADAAVAQGAKVVTVSLLPRCSNYGGACASRQVTHDAVNAGLASAADGFLRIHVDAYAATEQPTDTDDLWALYDSGDGLHPNQAGHDALGALISAAVFP